MRSLGLMLVIAACKQPAQERPPIDAVPVPIDAARAVIVPPVPIDAAPPRVEVPDEPWFYVQVRRNRARPPAALTRPMTATLRDQDAEALCALDARALAAFDALSERDREAASELLADCGESQHTPRFCTDARAIVDGPERPARTPVRGTYERSCSDDWEVARSVARAVDSPLATQLRQLGLLGTRPLGLAVGHDPSAAELMELDGRVVGFDTEMPDDHAHVARRIARVCALDAVFDQSERQALDAWVAGDHLRVSLRDLDDWYDVRAIVGLVNEVARTAKSDCRLIVLPNDGQEAFVAGGPGAGLVEALRAGLLRTDDPDGARRAGIAAE